MKKKDVEKILRDEGSEIFVPDVLNEVKSADFTFYREIPSDGKEVLRRAKPRIDWRKAVSIAAVFALIFVAALSIGLSASFDSKVYATVSLRTSSEFSLLINKSEKVIEIRTADTDTDAARILSEVSYEKNRLEKVLTELITLCIREGYIDAEQIANHDITVLIDCKDSRGAEHLRACVSGVINYCCGL
ncbi:MAG: hypothetical protein LBT20_08290 [Clostridiales bacterium]|jgi:hypothetical protein|nr:hypothetical protein [Clostridiales bacterium]